MRRSAILLSRTQTIAYISHADPDIYANLYSNVIGKGRYCVTQEIEATDADADVASGYITTVVFLVHCFWALVYLGLPGGFTGVVIMN